MNNLSIKVDLKTITVIVITVFNFLILGPVGWMVSSLWRETIDFRETTEIDIARIKEDLGSLSLESSRLYMTKSAFNEYKEEQGELYRHLDSKMTN